MVKQSKVKPRAGHEAKYVGVHMIDQYQWPRAARPTSRRVWLLSRCGKGKRMHTSSPAKARASVCCRWCWWRLRPMRLRRRPRLSAELLDLRAQPR